MNYFTPSVATAASPQPHLPALKCNGQKIMNLLSSISHVKLTLLSHQFGFSASIVTYGAQTCRETNSGGHQWALIGCLSQQGQEIWSRIDRRQPGC